MKKILMLLVAIVSAIAANAYTDVYIRGDMNGFNAEEAWKMQTTDGVTYTLTGVTFTKDKKFKIADSTYGDINYSLDNAEMNISNVTTLGYNKGNMWVNQDLVNATFTFKITSAKNSATLKIENNVQASQTRTVYFYNSSSDTYNSMYCYMYEGSNNNNGWPGKEMTATGKYVKDGDKYYPVWKYTYDCQWTPAKIIFMKNQSGDGGKFANDPQPAYQNNGFYTYANNTIAVNASYSEASLCDKEAPVKTPKYILAAHFNGYPDGNNKEGMTKQGDKYVTVMHFGEAGSSSDSDANKMNLGIRYYADETVNSAGWFSCSTSEGKNYTAADMAAGKDFSLSQNGDNNIVYPQLFGDVTFTLTVGSDGKPANLNIKGGAKTVTPADKTLYLVYKKTTTETNWTVMEPVKEGSNFKFAMPVENNKQVRFKFTTDKDCSNMDAKSDVIFAPSSPKMFISDNATANAGATYWYDLPNGNGVYNITAKFTNTDQTAISFSTTPNVTITASIDILYKLGNNDWVKMPNRIVVEGEYVQWNVTLKAQDKEVKFKIGDTEYGVGANGDKFWLVDEDRYGFRKLEANNKPFCFKNDTERTFQFIIRKFYDSDDYEVAARQVKADSFTVYSFGMTGSHPDHYGRSGIGITDFLEGKAGQAFTANMKHEDGQMSATVANNAQGEGTTSVLHWVKYEHPFWGYASAALMEYTGNNENIQSVADAIYYSDSYLYPGDPRVKAYFSQDQIDALGENGARTWSVDKAKDNSFNPQSTPHENDATPHRTDRTFYRVYMTMEKQHGAQDYNPANGPQRAVVNSDFAGNWGSRVAYTAELPSEVADIVSGVVEVEVEDNALYDGEAEYYTISGIRVYGQPAPGLYIVRRGSGVTKEIIR